MPIDNQKKLIVLFEDRAPRIAELRKEIDAILGEKYDFFVFPLDEEPPAVAGPYEEKIINILESQDLNRIVMLVTDQDLSCNKWGGLSEAAVTRVAERLGMPVACYRQAKTRAEDKVKRPPGNGQLELPNPATERAQRIITLCDGFEKMRSLLTQASEKNLEKILRQQEVGQKSKSNKAQPDSPGTLLARILGQPDVASHFDLFACGDQRAIAELLALPNIKKGDLTLNGEQERRLIVALGVWLADLVMEYPGLLVNETAAASYLDIAIDDFAKEDIKNLFAPAFYDSNLPFFDSARPLWWRHILDQIIVDNNALSGQDYCKQNGFAGIGFCACSDDKKLHAGFLCMATGKPISDSKSSGPVNWFPAGADLARLTARIHRAISPWLGA